MTGRGRVAVVTGASSGIGRHLAGQLSAAGWTVAVVGRDAARTAAVANATGGIPFLADYDSLDDVRALAAALSEHYPRIDVLANNAGGLLHERALSADGYERTLQHNHLAPFLLTGLLRDRLVTSGARVISTASIANRFGDLRLDDLQWERRLWAGGWRAYGTSKIATILFAAELARRTGLESYSVHPGYVETSFGAQSPLVRFGNVVTGGRLQIPVAQGAAPLVHLATASSIAAPNGSYFDGLRPNGRRHRTARDANLARELWEVSGHLVGLR